LPAHILYLFFSDYCASAISAKLIINKFIQVIPAGKTMRNEIVFMLIYFTNEIIRYPDIQSRPCISHNIYSKTIFLHSCIISERFRTSRNDIHTKAISPIFYNSISPPLSHNFIQNPVLSIQY
jgi:hypothetical protein